MAKCHYCNAELNPKEQYCPVCHAKIPTAYNDRGWSDFTGTYGHSDCWEFDDSRYDMKQYAVQGEHAHMADDGSIHYGNPIAPENRKPQRVASARPNQPGYTGESAGKLLKKAAQKTTVNPLPTAVPNRPRGEKTKTPIGTIIFLIILFYSLAASLMTNR